MDNTIIQQGCFVANGNVKYLALRSDVDWIRVINITEAAAVNADHGFRYFWQRNMEDADISGIVEYHPAADHTVAIDTLAIGNGFTLYDKTDMEPGARIALTALTAANPPVITSATLPSVGDIVRFDHLDNQTQFSGIDFSVSASGGGTFSIGNIVSTNSVASTAGYWRSIPNNPIFYPSRRTVSYVSVGASAAIYLTVKHTYKVGQKVRLSFPGGAATWGDYAKMDGELVAITAINQARAGNEPTNAAGDNNIVVDFSTIGYTTWETTFGPGHNQSYPPTASNFTPATVVPIGHDPAESLTIGDVATENMAEIGIKFEAGALSPAGSDADKIIWIAGKSFSNTLG